MASRGKLYHVLSVGQNSGQEHTNLARRFDGMNGSELRCWRFGKKTIMLHGARVRKKQKVQNTHPGAVAMLIDTQRALEKCNSVWF